MEVSLSLEKIYRATRPELIHIEKFQSITDHTSFVEAVHYAIENIVQVKLEGTKSNIYEDENEISDRVVHMLSCLLYDATREESNNGNVDVTVKFREFTWLGEAKIFGDNTKLKGGFRQLASRYSEAARRESAVGGYLIYNFRPNTKKLIDSYKSVSKIIFEKEFENFSQVQCTENDLRFYTSHQDVSSGLNYKIKHFPFTFYHGPIDDSGKNHQENINRKKAKKVARKTDK